MSNSGSGMAATIYSLAKELWGELDRGQQVLLGSIVGLALVSLAYGWGASGDLTQAALHFGFILIIYALFHIAFYYSAQYLPDGSKFIRYGLLAGGGSVFLCSVLYSGCMFVAPNSNCTFSPDPIVIFERFGRFYFFAYPLIVGISLVYSSLRYLQLSKIEADNSGLENEANHLSRPVAVLLIILVVIQVILIALVSGSVKGLYLASKGPDLGDIDPVTHMGGAVLFGIVGLVGCFMLERKWRNWGIASRWLILSQPVCILLFSAAVIQRFGRPNSFFQAGTGLGVIVAVCLIVFSFVVITSYGIRVASR